MSSPDRGAAGLSGHKGTRRRPASARAGGADAQLSRALHIALTVRDMRVSADWYQRVLGFEFVKEFQVAPGDAGIPRILLLHQHSGFLLGLCGHPGPQW